MGRVVLRPHVGPPVDRHVAAGLDPDPVPLEEGRVGATLTVRLQTHSGYDDAGNPTYTWDDGPQVTAVLTIRSTEDRQEQVVRYTATATLLAGDTPIPTESTVADDEGHVWEVTAARSSPVQRTLTLSRTELME